MFKKIKGIGKKGEGGDIESSERRKKPPPPPASGVSFDAQEKDPRGG